MFRSSPSELRNPFLSLRICWLRPCRSIRDTIVYCIPRLRKPAILSGCTGSFFGFSSRFSFSWSQHLPGPARKVACSTALLFPLSRDDEGDRRAGWAVGFALAITVITLFIILVLSVITGKRVEGLTSKNPVTIQITGHQWWWEISYPNSQADQTVTTANEIHVPVGTPVVVLTNSADVIHSFWAPSITGKRDLAAGIFVGFLV